LTTALSLLPGGYVVVGSLPTTNGKSATAKLGCLIMLGSSGKPVSTISGPQIAGPWDMTAATHGNVTTLFVSTVLKERQAGRILHVPVLDGRGHIRTAGATRQRDGPVGMQLHLDRELLRATASKIDADLAHRLDHVGPHALATRVFTSGLGMHVRRGQLFKERLRHLRPTSILAADEENVSHPLHITSITIIGVDVHSLITPDIATG
jgi:hypothetical protein